MAFISGTNFSEALFGTAASDTIDALGGNDFLSGEGGNDKLFGGEGLDKLNGGTGSDRLDGGPGTDTADYSKAPNGVDVNLFQGNGFDGTGSVDTLISIENSDGSNFSDGLTGNSNPNLLRGNDGNDSIFGFGGNDILLGGQGDDFIKGGEGKDKISGGTGADNLLYTATSDSGVGTLNRDVITGFEHGVDKINVSGIDAKAGPLGNEAFTFIGSADFSAEGQIRVFNENGNTIVQLNTSGASGAESEIELTGLVNPSASDFIL